MKKFHILFVVLLLSMLTLPLAAFAHDGNWQNPTAAPTGDNAHPPINISSVRQVKTGSLGINGALGVNGLIHAMSKLVVGGTTTELPSADLLLDVEGKVGATAYCDNNGQNCATPPFDGSDGSDGTDGTPGTGGTGDSFWAGSLNGSIHNLNTYNVGIGTGTAAPLAKLDVVGGDTFLSRYLMIRDFSTGAPATNKLYTRNNTFQFGGGGVSIGFWNTTPGFAQATGNLVVQQKVGAAEYCDVRGENCATPPLGGGGASGVSKIKAGSNITISPASGVGEVTINAGSGSGGLPAGTAGQTLRHNGTAWLANSYLTNDNTKVGIGLAHIKGGSSGGLWASKDVCIDGGTNNGLCLSQLAPLIGGGRRSLSLTDCAWSEVFPWLHNDYDYSYYCPDSKIVAGVRTPTTSLAGNGGNYIKQVYCCSLSLN